ncbi:MAG: DUF3106 domain-containing protein [bacterium]|nr:DUF3106 domain-containing protein [bacterium]
MSATERRRLVRAWAVTFLLAGFFALTVAAAAGSEETAPTARPDRANMIERWQKATPVERRAMRAEVRKRLEDASPRERRRAGRRMRALERALPEFSPIERLALLRAAATLPAEERKALRQRLRGIDDLEPAERKAFVDELEAMIQGRSGEIERFERNRRRWRDMSEAERQEAREQMKRLREMSVEERRELLREMEAAKRR